MKIPEDKIVAKNPVVLVAAVAVAAPAIITAGENAAVWVQVSSKVAVGAGLLEGYVKSKFEKSPPDMPYTFESLPFQVTSDAYQQINPILFPNSVKK